MIASRGGAERPRRLVLLGHPVAHSLSPRFQNAALAAAGIPLEYSTLDVTPAALAARVHVLVAEGAAGNATIPHKEALAALCDELTPLARRVGAANTWWVDGGRLVGDNTDVGGFDHLARTVCGAATRSARVAVLGAGGSAAAVLAAIDGWQGADARVYNRVMERALRLCARAGGRAVASLDEAIEGATVVVNATPLGLAGADAAPVPVEQLPAGAAVLDLVYQPGETRWVRDARAAGHPAADGLGMLVEQGALSFERWLGVAPDRAVMWAAVR